MTIISRWLLLSAMVATSVFSQDLGSDDAAPASTESSGSLSDAQPAAPAPVQPQVVEQPVYKESAPQQQVELISNESMYRAQYEQGSSTQMMGRIFSWGGLALSILGNSSGNATLSGVGSIALIAGIPINGAGSSKMVSSVNKLNPTANVEHRGWAPYFTGVGLTTLGIVLLFDAVSDADSEDGISNATKDKVINSILLITAGEICMIVGWYKFSASADDAEAAYSTVKVSGAPLLIPEVQGNGFAKGFQVVAAF